MKYLAALLPSTLSLITCNDYADVLDVNFCKDRPDGNYPVNDDNCSLFYNCLEGLTFCESCDERQEDTPYFKYREGDWGICTWEYDTSVKCPTPGFPDNAKNERPEPEPTEEPTELG